MSTTSAAIDDLLPYPRYRIAAESLIDTPASVVWAELLALPMSSLPWGFTLTRLRHLPDVLAGNETSVRGTDTFLDATPIPVVIHRAPEIIISAGLSQAWKIRGGARAPFLDATQFAAWNEPGWIKVAMQFHLAEAPGGRTTRLTTETRISATDTRTARVFAPYWWAIRAGSVLIRREVVAQVRRRAESR